jgi:hypothetical protein
MGRKFTRDGRSDEGERLAGMLPNCGEQVARVTCAICELTKYEQKTDEITLLLYAHPDIADFNK